jgi:hypothetical protein
MIKVLNPDDSYSLNCHYYVALSDKPAGNMQAK